jgi:hypothetical protein
MITTVLGILRNTDFVTCRAALHAYKQRHGGRPPFQQALADQVAPIALKAPTTLAA